MAFFLHMKQAIGIFDSGVGGLSLIPAIQERLPHEDIVYIADHGFFPYGDKSTEVVLARAKKITAALVQHNCKLILVACNTVTTQVIDELRKAYSLPFVGIEPAIKPAAAASKTGVVGVLATKGTFKSDLYHQTIAQHASKIKVVEQVGEGLVEMVENDQGETEEDLTLLQTLTTPLLDQGMDTLLLGCTHYPFLTPSLKKTLPETVKIIDNSLAVAKQIERLLPFNTSTSKGNIRYYTTGEKKSWRGISFTALPL